MGRLPTKIETKVQGGLVPQSTPATEEKQDDIIDEIKPLDSIITTLLTLTDADTAYKCPASEMSNRRTISLYNGSDTDMYHGDSSVTTSTGDLLPAGGHWNGEIKANLYIICGTAGKKVRINEYK
ncbi:MAG: hypothetical protein U9R08_02910 [Nanoarchaeota archaeon]|nr:hypothetical protein [Nanoarchaeota archaeon]